MILPSKSRSSNSPFFIHLDIVPKAVGILLKVFEAIILAFWDGSWTAGGPKIELFLIIVSSFQPLTVIPKCTILDATVLDPPLALIKISFEGESLIHSFKSFLIFSISLLPHAPYDKRKRFLRRKTIALYLESIVLELTILLFCYQLYSLVISTVSISVGGWMITDESCLLRSFPLSLHLFIYRFKPAPYL